MDLEVFETLVLVVHVMAALAIIGLVLLQQGKGADMGSGFGSGASNTVFGSSGAGDFLWRATSIIAVAFFITSFGLAYFAKEKSLAMSDLDMPAVVQPAAEQAPVDQPDSELPTIEKPATDSEIPEG